MAIDTLAKRASATFMVVPSYAVGLIPDGTISVNDRMAVSWLYSGISAALPIIQTVISEDVIVFTSYIDQERNFTSYLDQERNFTSYIDQERTFNLEF